VVLEGHELVDLDGAAVDEPLVIDVKVRCGSLIDAVGTRPLNHDRLRDIVSNGKVVRIVRYWQGLPSRLQAERSMRISADTLRALIECGRMPQWSIVFAALAVSQWIEHQTAWGIKGFVRSARR
jgi:hypothetical protein